MVRHRVDLRLPGRVRSAPFVNGDRRPVAMLRIDGGADVALFGSAGNLRRLAAAAPKQAEQPTLVRGGGTSPGG